MKLYLFILGALLLTSYGYSQNSITYNKVKYYVWDVDSLTGMPGDILGYKLPHFIEKERSQLSLKFKQENYEKAINLLLETELLLKSSKVDKNSILISTLISLQTLL